MPVFAQSAGKLVFMEPCDMAMEYIHEMNAIVGGHFEKEGLTVEIASIRNTFAAIQQVVTGQAFVGRVGLLDVFVQILEGVAGLAPSNGMKCQGNTLAGPSSRRHAKSASSAYNVIKSFDP